MTSTGISKFKKLRGKSLDEVCVRGSQELSALRERLFGLEEINKVNLLRSILPASRNGSEQGTVALIIKRINTAGAQTFFPVFAHRSEVCAQMDRRFADQKRKLIESADRVLDGKFDLLGYGGLDFGTPIDWHLEPISGKRTPLAHWSRIDFLDPKIAGDKKITWELNRHQFFVSLGQAYWLTADERYADGFVQLMTSWMDANPPGKGINWASSLEVSFRTISWLWALHLFSGSDRLTMEFAARMLKCLLAHGRHIEKYLSHYFSPNTHLTGEALGLFYLGMALPEFRRAESWRKTGLKILHEQLFKQIRADGVYFEQATYYHRYTTDFYMHVLALARTARMKIPTEIEHRLISMLDYLMWITRPDGSSPLIGDDDGGRLLKLGLRPADDFRDTLANGAALIGRGDWKFVAKDAAVETLWLLGPEGLAKFDKVKAELPNKQARAFVESGYFVFRDGWLPESGYLLIDCGPHGSLGCGHAHADALSLEFSALGNHWLSDSGTFTYTGDAELRDRFRGTASHNTVVVDDQPQSVSSGPFSWSNIAQCRPGEFITTENFGYFEGSHDGYRRLADPVKHTRSVMFMKASIESQLPPYLIVRDKFAARAKHRYAINYHFPPESKAELSGNQIEVTKSGGGNLTIATFGSTELQAQVGEDLVSQCYGHCAPAPSATFTAEGTGSQEFGTLVVPKAAGQVINVGRLVVSERGEGCFSIQTGKSRDIILMGDQASQLSSDSISASGSMAWARMVNGSAISAGLLSGRAISVDGRLSFISQYLLRYCLFVFRKDWMEISLYGTRQFELKLRGPVGRVIVNGTGFTLDRKTRSASFENDGNGWRLKMAQLSAV